MRMTVFQEDSSVKPSADSTNGPTTSKSSIETTVVVDDGQTLVLGGLLKDGSSDSRSQVPFLGDLPIIGSLFRSRERTRGKTNLMVFLRPVVLRNQEAANNLTMDRYDYMRNAQQDLSSDNRAASLAGDGPTLDPLKLSSKLSMPSVRQPLDDPNAPAPTVVMPASSGFAPKLMPSTAPQATPAASGK